MGRLLLLNKLVEPYERKDAKLLSIRFLDVMKLVETNRQKEQLQLPNNQLKSVPCLKQQLDFFLPWSNLKVFKKLSALVAREVFSRTLLPFQLSV